MTFGTEKVLKRLLEEIEKTAVELSLSNWLISRMQIKEKADEALVVLKEEEAENDNLHG